MESHMVSCRFVNRKLIFGQSELAVPHHFDGSDNFQKLKSEFPKLSEHELRFCAYACSGLDSKQIAFILNIQIESIRKIRQRLRKKLGLDPAESLEEFLRNFSADTPPAGNTATAPD